MSAVTTATPGASLAMPANVRQQFRARLRDAGLEPRSPSPPSSLPAAPSPGPSPSPTPPAPPAATALVWQPRAGRWLGLAASGVGLWLGAGAVRPQTLVRVSRCLPSALRRPLSAAFPPLAEAGLAIWTLGILWAASRAARATAPAMAAPVDGDGAWSRQALHAAFRGLAAGAFACVLAATRLGRRTLVPAAPGLSFVAAAALGLECGARTARGDCAWSTELAAVALAGGLALLAGPSAAGGLCRLSAGLAAALVWQCWATDERQRQMGPASPVEAGMLATESAIGLAFVLQLVLGVELPAGRVLATADWAAASVGLLRVLGSVRRGAPEQGL